MKLELEKKIKQELAPVKHQAFKYDNLQRHEVEHTGGVETRILDPEIVSTKMQGKLLSERHTLQEKRKYYRPRQRNYGLHNNKSSRVQNEMQSNASMTQQ